MEPEGITISHENADDDELLFLTKPFALHCNFLWLCQDLNKHLRSPGSLPESLLSKYRPAPRTTALVLWKPPGGVIPDLITSALRSGAGSTVLDCRLQGYN